ncbi:insulinase family protein (plasmid) [Sphingomonas sp. NY01]|uniref:M16 family metallopeptidase n=1 Tax=Sphingomonas sp. NY01 TaxID=2968057 RepID=UPI00315C7ADC
MLTAAAITAFLPATSAWPQAGPDSVRPVATPVAGPAAEASTSFTLRNGLKVVVRPDRRLPIVTAIVIYNVGAKDEKRGQYGYAHLFEHLMLGGSKHWVENSTLALTNLGASEINATTTEDRTIFYETVPRSALERTLFLEADRMGYLADALTPAKVAREVDVVLNEKRQRGGAPYGRDFITIGRDLYPADHPYHHGVIGEDADLRAITVKDATDWFRAYYGPANASLILTGDIAPEEARALVEKYFASLAPRAPLDRVLTQMSPLPGALRREMFEAVPTARIYATHAAPPAGSPDIPNLDLIAQIMANGANSRLSRHLVTELGIANAAMVTFDERLLSSQMGFVVDVKAPDQVRRVETEMEAVIARFVAEGPSEEELASAREARLAYVRRMQDSTFGKAFLLMRGVSMTDDPDYAATYVRQLNAATRDSVRRTAERVYGRPGHRLIVRPLPAVKATPGGYDLAKGPPPVGPAQPIAFPAVERARLSNGLNVVLVPRPGTSTASMLMRFDSGTASVTGPVDAITAAMLVDPKGSYATRADALGSRLQGGANLDVTDVSLSAETAKLPAIVALMGDVIARPDFSEAELTKVRTAYLDALRREAAAAPSYRRIMRNALYGAAHPYGTNRAAAEDIAAIEAVTLPAVKTWAQGHVRPDRAVLYVAGDTTMATLRPLLDAAFEGWAGRGPAATDAPVPAAPAAPAPQLIVIDQPGAGQSFLDVGRTISPTPKDNDLAIEAADGVYGNMTGARIRTTLREKRGWTYGIGSGTDDARGPRMWQIAGSVDAAHTGEAIAELIREMRAMNGDDPPLQDELDRIVNGSINRVAAKLESNADIVAAMADSESYGRPYDAIVRDPATMRTLSLAQVRGASKYLLDPMKMKWVVVGDWNRIRDQLTGLGLGEPVVLRAPE